MVISPEIKRYALSFTGHVAVLLFFSVMARFSTSIHVNTTYPQNMIKLTFSAPPAPQKSVPAPKEQQPKKPPAAPQKKTQPVKHIQAKQPLKPVLPSFDDTISRSFSDIDTKEAPAVYESPSSKDEQSQPIPAATARSGEKNIAAHWYLDLICAKIANNWTQPNVLVVPGIAMSNTVYFTVSPEGAVSHISIKRPARSPEFDASTIAAVKKASPLPPLPADLREHTLEINLEFNLER